MYISVMISVLMCFVILSLGWVSSDVLLLLYKFCVLFLSLGRSFPRRIAIIMQVLCFVFCCWDVFHPTYSYYYKSSVFCFLSLGRVSPDVLLLLYEFCVLFFVAGTCSPDVT